MPAELEDYEDDLDGLLDDAPDDLEDEDDLLEWFTERLGIPEDEIKEILAEASSAASIVAALTFLKIFSTAWDAVDEAQDKSIEANTESIGKDLDQRLDEIARDMADGLKDQIEDDWGGEDGSGVAVLADINAQSEYGDSKHEADEDAGWDFAQYIAETTACDVCQDCHGTILPMDDPWWDDHEPDANHPNCKCIKVPLSAEEAEKRGGTTEAPDVEVSGWKEKWPPDVSEYPDVLQAIYHSKS